MLVFITRVGHSQEKNLSLSFHTISTCPFTSKALDKYVRELSQHDWNNAQAETQFLGPNISHDLASLLITETINHSLTELNLPVFCLLLNAHSAFELTIRELFLWRMHLLGTNDQRLTYIDNCHKHRKTYK